MPAGAILFCCRKKKMTDEKDITAWQELVKDICRLKSTNRESGIFQRPLPLKIVPKISPNAVYHGAPLQELSAGNTDNIDKQTARRFRRGDFAVEAELDLHGYNENKAYDAVVSFVKKAYLQGKRCIAIITGKGLHQNDEDDIFASRGVLKNRVPQWLNMPEIRPLILAINHPEQLRGGSGVIEILLRRHRS